MRGRDVVKVLEVAAPAAPAVSAPHVAGASIRK